MTNERMATPLPRELRPSSLTRSCRVMSDFNIVKSCKLCLHKAQDVDVVSVHKVYQSICLRSHAISVPSTDCQFICYYVTCKSKHDISSIEEAKSRNARHISETFITALSH